MKDRSYIVGDWASIEQDGGRYVGRIKEIRGSMAMIVFQPGGNWLPFHFSKLRPATVFA
jgi:hypothetical protein